MAPLYVRPNGRPAPSRNGFRPAQAPPAALAYGLPRPEPSAAQRPPGVSLCMIVKNEERFIDACLRSAAHLVDEICIVDTGSTDRTIEIARMYGARIEHRAWRDDFAWARNEALALATKRWILVLDADEELDGASCDVIRSVRSVPAAHTGLWVRCKNLSDDYKGTGVSSHAIVRFFPNSERIRYKSSVHEYITLDGKLTGLTAKPSPLSITHHGYLSEIVKLRKKSERNLALVKTAAEADPTEPFNWYNVGTTSMLCNDPNAAVDAFEKMRTLVGEAERGFIPNGLAQLADLYLGRNECGVALEIANECLSKAPNFANGHFVLGRILAKQGRFPEARAAFEAAIADAAFAARQFIIDDEVCVWKAHSEIGGTYGHEGNTLAALEWFDRALRNRPLVIPLRINRARALELLERYDEAAAMFKGLADDEPGDVHSVDYVNFLLRRNDYALALTTIEAILAVVTPRTQATLLAAAARIAGHTGTADVQTLLERAVAAHGGAVDALEPLEILYRSRGDLAAVERLRAKELDAPLTLAADYARRATRYLSLGRLTDAEAVTRAGLELAPAEPALHNNLGAVLVQTARKEAALDELAAAGTDGDIGLRALFLRAIVLGDLGRYAEAVAAVDAVIALAPNEIDARLQRFRFVAALGRDDEAERTLREALPLGDQRVPAELAAWLLRKGRFTEAQLVAETALQSA
jgi:tetratricopeptide (TPR) repeat protein